MDQVDMMEDHQLEDHQLFWIGLALIITTVLVLLILMLSCLLHSKDNTGTSGGLDGIEIFVCLPASSITFIIGGIFCMVSTDSWCLVLIVIINIFSVLIHIYGVCNWTGWKTPRPGASEAITRKVGTAWTRIIPEVLGIALSVAAVGVAIGIENGRNDRV